MPDEALHTVPARQVQKDVPIRGSGELVDPMRLTTSEGPAATLHRKSEVAGHPRGVVWESGLGHRPFCLTGLQSNAPPARGDECARACLEAGVNEMPGPFDYSLFGLHIRSDLLLPELLGACPESEPQVFVQLGRALPAVVTSAGLLSTEAGVLLTIDGIARYAIADGCRIIVDRESGVPDANVRLYLLGSAMGVLLHQRGMLPLHANAVEIEDGAFAFMGVSGSGKSTLAASFHDKGYRVIADDVCAVRFDRSRRPFVTPGLPRLRLWQEALEGTGRQPSQYSRSYAGDDNWDKFDVPLPHETAVRAEVELVGVYLLERGESLSISQLRGLDATQAVFSNTYRGSYVPAAGNVQGHWEACMELVRQTPIFEIRRAWDLGSLAQDVQQIIAHAEALVRSRKALS